MQKQKKNRKKRVKPIGILGGMGPQATADLYQKIISLAVARGAKNDADFPELLISSIQIPEFINIGVNTPTKRLEKIFIKKINQLESAGVGQFAIACNTAHLIADKVVNKVNLPMISMVERVCRQIKRRKFKKVGILGSPTTINSKLYERALGKVGVSAILPTDKQLVQLEQIIRSVMSESLTNKQRQSLEKIIDDLKTRGAEVIILGCTELPLAVDIKRIGQDLISSTDVLVAEIIKQSGL